jgi:nucleotide-binding universal stress UspA family protein
LIKKILVALDGSEPAEKALDFAIDLASKYSAEVTLLSVVYAPMFAYASPNTGGYPSIGGGLTPTVFTSYRKDLKTFHKQVLSKAQKKIAKAKPDVKVSTKLVEGRPSEKIIETADKGNFDIIVMGSRGLGGIKEFLLGSVSHRVADDATCAVLIIK